MATRTAVKAAHAVIWLSAIAVMLAAAYWLSPAHRRDAQTESRGVESKGSTSREDLDSTIASMNARLVTSPGDGRSAVTLADALLRQARVTGNAGLAVRAEAALKAVLDHTPDHYESRRMLAAVYLSQHRFREAITAAERCQQTRPNDAWTFGVVGDAHLELGDYPEAFAAFDRMAALRPDSASYARASYARELQGDLDGALHLMTMAAEATAPQDPESLAWHYAQIGHLYLEMNRVDEARRAFEHANFIFPDHPFASDGLARVEDAEGRTSSALALIMKRLAKSPSPADAAFAGELLERLGRTDEAERQYQLAEAGWRVDAPEPAKLARFLADHHRHLDAAVHMAEQASADRHDIFTEDALAWAYFRDGRVSDARKAIARALRTGSRDREIHRHADAILAAG